MFIIKSKVSCEEHVLRPLYNVLHATRTPPYFEECLGFLCDDHNRDLSSKKDNLLTPPFTRSEYFRESFTVKGAQLWNDPPSEIRHSKTFPIRL